MSIYKDADGEARVRDWCEARVERGPWSQRRTVPTDLGSTHVASVGEGDRSVLWFPGTNFNAATCGALAEHLCGSFRFHVADLPGQPGLSDARHPGKDRVARYGAWADQVTAALRASGEGPVVIAGHSLGAAVALAATPSADLAGTVLVSPAGLRSVTITPKLLAVSVPWFLRPTERRSAALLRYMHGESFPLDGDLIEWLTIAARHSRQVGAPGPLPRSVVERWRDRAVVLTGTGDRFFSPARLRPTAEQSLGTPVEAVDGAGHLLPDERPDRVASALEAVFERHRESGRTD